MADWYLGVFEAARNGQVVKRRVLYSANVLVIASSAFHLHGLTGSFENYIPKACPVTGFGGDSRRDDDSFAT